MIRTFDQNDWQLAQRLNALDPFQLAQPLWINPKRVLEMLPEVLPNMRPTREQIRQREIDMAVKFIEERSAPARLHARGVISGTPEYRDTLNAIRDIPAGKAIVITLESEELLKGKKPETTFAYTIRRYLAAHNIAATAYQSGKAEVVVIRSAGGAAPKKRKK